jgi:hypothetical protein
MNKANEEETAEAGDKVMASMYAVAEGDDKVWNEMQDRAQISLAHAIRANK